MRWDNLLTSAEEGRTLPGYREPAVVRHVLAGLPPREREAVFLSFYAGLTHPEVASVCRIPLGTAKSRIRVGLERMASALPEAA